MQKSAVTEPALAAYLGARQSPEGEHLQGAVRGLGVGTASLGSGLGAGFLGHQAAQALGINPLLGAIPMALLGSYGGYRGAKELLWPKHWTGHTDEEDADTIKGDLGKLRSMVSPERQKDATMEKQSLLGALGLLAAREEKQAAGPKSGPWAKMTTKSKIPSQKPGQFGADGAVSDFQGGSDGNKPTGDIASGSSGQYTAKINTTPSRPDPTNATRKGESFVPGRQAYNAPETQQPTDSRETAMFHDPATGQVQGGMGFGKTPGGKNWSFRGGYSDFVDQEGGLSNFRRAGGRPQAWHDSQRYQQAPSYGSIKDYAQQAAKGSQPLPKSPTATTPADVASEAASEAPPGAKGEPGAEKTPAKPSITPEERTSRQTSVPGILGDVNFGEDSEFDKGVSALTSRFYNGEIDEAQFRSGVDRFRSESKARATSSGSPGVASTRAKAEAASNPAAPPGQKREQEAKAIVGEISDLDESIVGPGYAERFTDKAAPISDLAQQSALNEPEPAWGDDPSQQPLPQAQAPAEESAFGDDPSQQQPGWDDLPEPGLGAWGDTAARFGDPNSAAFGDPGAKPPPSTPPEPMDWGPRVKAPEHDPALDIPAFGSPGAGMPPTGSIGGESEFGSLESPGAMGDAAARAEGESPIPLPTPPAPARKMTSDAPSRTQPAEMASWGKGFGGSGEAPEGHRGRTTQESAKDWMSGQRSHFDQTGKDVPTAGGATDAPAPESKPKPKSKTAPKASETAAKQNEAYQAKKDKKDKT